MRLNEMVKSRHRRIGSDIAAGDIKRNVIVMGNLHPNCVDAFLNGLSCEM